MSVTLSKIMQEYLNEGDNNKRYHLISEAFFVPRNTGCIDVPLQAVDYSQWEIVTDPNRFKREFAFNAFPELKAFLDEVLEYQEEVGHHGKIVLDGLSILIEVYTHDVNDVTELDQEYVEAVENIHRDVQDYFLTDENDDNGWG